LPGDEFAGAIAHIESTGDADASRWLNFLQAAALDVDLQSTAAGRCLSLRHWCGLPGRSAREIASGECYFGPAGRNRHPG
jgi:hypothetical protein